MKVELLVVDPEVTEASPSLRSLLLARPLLEQKGVHFRFLTQRCELPGENAWHRVPGGKLPSLLRTWLFLLYVHLWGWRYRKSTVPTVVLANDGMCLWADVVLFHFFNPAWLRIEKTLPRHDWRDYAALVRTWQGWLQDVLQAKFGRWKFLNSVSQSILDEIRPWVRNRTGTVGVLPNVVPVGRFTRERRRADREAAREKLAYSAEDKIFLFVSQGHHRRKGFWLAVGAVALARKRGFRESRLHVVGGFPPSLERLQRRLDEKFSDWRRWMTFVGMVSDPEAHFAAADALLFPSYFEAFSLVEIEAAAMGLPLLLTPHHGSEMILEDGMNGRLLPYDVPGIADILVEGIRTGFPVNTNARAGAQSVEDFSRILEMQIRQSMVGADTSARRTSIDIAS